MSGVLHSLDLFKIHGGTTEEDIIWKVNEAQQLAVHNQKLCEDYAAQFKSTQVLNCSFPSL